ncbi:MAG: prolipoprotein diacylglyceryl transferase [Chloroflexi bacterium]|nr:prolipoprotein diacylglyceryl transferase [Chloroflexota bacterium]MDL1942012.1 prolipoprotein diacylglyceryl transferase [Chloroflexi bacterium CFX2]
MDINPVIFSFKLFGMEFSPTWYGLIVMVGVLIGAWIAEKEVRRLGENGEVLVDAMIWAVVSGIIGARLWYVANSILGGSRLYIEDPLAIIRPPIAGLHFFGGLLFGALALILFLKRNGYDSWLFLDAIAPVTLIGQAFGRLGNFINQELYGPPTELPWGIPIPASHRLPQFSDLSLYPVETTRFHPTFAYEAILNVLAFLFLMWYSRQKEEELKPGTTFSLWLICAGFIRTFIEFFRPDQPTIGDTFITTSMLVAFLMGVAGILLLMVRNGSLTLPIAEGWEEEYKIKPVEKPSSARSRGAASAAPAKAEEEAKEMETGLSPVRRRSMPKAKKTTAEKPAARKPPAARKKKTG